MLRHNKSAISMKFVCFGIAKLEYQKLNIIVYFFSISYMSMNDLLKKKICKENKSKKSQNTLNMIASVYSRRCGSYRMYLKGDSPHQTVMIVCELKWFSHIIITCIHLCNLAMFFTHNTQYCLLLLIHVPVQCDLVITRFTRVNVYSLNCLDLFLKNKID